MGIGNRLRGDDIVGSYLAQELRGKITIGIIDAREALENHLNQIETSGRDLIVFIDAAHSANGARFKLFSPDELVDSFHFTHESSLKSACLYLQRAGSFDILILGIHGYDFPLKESMSQGTKDAGLIVKYFLLKNFPKDDLFR